MTAFSSPGSTRVSDLETFQTLATDEERRLRRIVTWVIIAVLVIIGAGLAWLSSEGTIASGIFKGYLAFLIGGLVGAGELVARYRDAPFRSLVRNSSSVYLGVNAGAAAVAYFLIVTLGLTFETVAPDNPAAAGALQVLVAGFGAMALFRSSLFIARIGEQEVGIGPSIVLQTVLNAADAGVDRESARARAPAVEQIMRSVDIHKARDVLPMFCYRLLQSSLPEGEYNVMKSKIEDIFKGPAPTGGGEEQDKISENSKAYLLGLTLMNYMGADVLKVAVNTLGPEIKKPPKLYLKDITKEIDEGEGGEVEVSNYLVSAEDAEGNAITPVCTPAAPSKFPVGQTTIITCQATDNATGLTTKGSFKVALTRKSDPLKDPSLTKDGVS